VVGQAPHTKTGAPLSEALACPLARLGGRGRSAGIQRGVILKLPSLATSISLFRKAAL